MNDGLTAHYEFEGDETDSSGNGHHGSESGGVNYVSGVIGQAASFDGVDDFITLFNSSSESGFYSEVTSKTISLFFMPTTCGSDIQNNGDVFDSNLVDLYFGEDASRASPLLLTEECFLKTWKKDVHNDVKQEISEVNLDNWYHAVIVYNAEQERVDAYFNGDIMSSINGSEMGFSVDADLLVGKRQYYDDRFFSGNIDDLRIYNRALSDAEIQELYELGAS